MDKQMNNRTKLGLIIVTLVAVAVVTAFWALVLRQQHFSGLGQSRIPPARPVHGDFEFFYLANTIVSTINIALLVILTIIYTSIYLKTKSSFTLGLIVLALAFLVENLTSNPLIASIYGFRAYGLGPFEFLPGLFELIALSVLLYLSIKY
jgi:hypothetical protein